MQSQNQPQKPAPRPMSQDQTANQGFSIPPFTREPYTVSHIAHDQRTIPQWIHSHEQPLANQPPQIPFGYNWGPGELVALDMRSRNNGWAIQQDPAVLDFRRAGDLPRTVVRGAKFTEEYAIERARTFFESQLPIHEPVRTENEIAAKITPLAKSVGIRDRSVFEKKNPVAVTKAAHMELCRRLELWLAGQTTYTQNVMHNQNVTETWQNRSGQLLPVPQAPLTPRRRMAQALQAWSSQPKSPEANTAENTEERTPTEEIQILQLASYMVGKKNEIAAAQSQARPQVQPRDSGIDVRENSGSEPEKKPLTSVASANSESHNGYGSLTQTQIPSSWIVKTKPHGKRQKHNSRGNNAIMKERMDMDVRRGA